LIISLNTKTQAIDEISMQYLAGAINQAMELNIEVITIFFSMIQHMSPEEIIRYLQSQGISGIIIYGMSKDDINLQQLIAAEVFKCVVVDAPYINLKTTAVWIDNEKAQYDVAKKTILDNTCEHVLYIAGKRNAYVTEERLKGMKRLASELNLKILIRDGDFSERKARQIVFRYAKNKDVVVCASDIMAIGAMNALTEMDIFRPVCGFDGITLMGYVGKQMNTIRQDFYHIAAHTVEELQRLLHGDAGRNLILEHKIVRMYYEDIIC